MQGVYTYIKLKCYLYPPWKTGPLRRSRLLLLAPEFSKLLSSAASSEGQLAHGFSRDKCFFVTRRLTGTRFFTLWGTWHRSTATRETKLIMLLKILNISHLNIKDADSRAGYSLTNNWWCNSFCTKPALPCVFDCLPSRHNFLSTRLKIGKYGAAFYSNCSPRVKLRTVSNKICGSNGSVYHADHSLREKVSLCEYRMTQKILHTCYCNLHFLMLGCNPIERHSKDGMQLWGIPHN